jgi:hypothetical protein
MVFLCYSKGVLEHIFWHFFKIFTCHCDLIIYKSLIYHFLTHFLYVNYHNLNVRCLKINIFYNGFCKHGGEVALIWTWPSSWIVGIKKCSSNTTWWSFWSWKFVVGSCHSTHWDATKPLPCWGCIHSLLMAMFIPLLWLLQLCFITFITFMHQNSHPYYTCLDVMFTIW